jgi:hypothetical protein
VRARAGRRTRQQAAAALTQPFADPAKNGLRRLRRIVFDETRVDPIVPDVADKILELGCDARGQCVPVEQAELDGGRLDEKGEQLLV